MASLLAAIVILPLLLKHLSETEYRDLAMLGRDSFVAATLNSLGAALLFVLLWMLTIPLWLIPDLALAGGASAADGLAQPAYWLLTMPCRHTPARRNGGCCPHATKGRFCCWVCAWRCSPVRCWGCLPRSGSAGIRLRSGEPAPFAAGGFARHEWRAAD